MVEISDTLAMDAAARERRRRIRRPHRLTPRPDERVMVLGQAVDLVRPEEVLHRVGAAIRERRRFVVANHNLNSLNLIRDDVEMQRFYRSADLVEVDSTPLIAFARLLGIGGRRFHRCTYLDWRDHFWSLADRNGWRVMQVGGAAGVGDLAAERLARRYPRVVIRSRHGYFDVKPGSAENAAVLAEIGAFRPDVLFVGMGMPRQEHWVIRNLEALPHCPILTVGAAFDYEAGVQAAAPRWMGQMGLEWLYRLARDPRRLFRRYCIEPWGLAGPALRDIGAALRRSSGRH
jgi:N-acetylglucosaminyldiphosphoundecaprenol N-acetyl-beta-D-mannosaminyltransferase